ncbi:hypothetical protein N7517_000471 [Penicillium concentricum]|uniref:Aminoglycoside phosphotransferase domain-containing protein n=1 Tax=Penicillium concentricum TaxID=293559 RepID=A0A9W9SR12_9EURO|nr:uncharacterized protein N7517_000471 [Penicillium concentricum]KAJ5382560.1 hypothetical protein N7517_000471 [Penicillium concentricum]
MRTYVVYRHDDAINDFFKSNTTVTRQQCDDFAIARAGDVQGVCSYTVTAGPNKSKLFQFREADSTIDMRNISLAKAVHSEFVASCTYLGALGDSRPLHIYEMETLPRTAHIMAQFHQTTCPGRDRFFAQSWNYDQRPCSDDTDILIRDFEYNFDVLAQDLPSRFTPNLERVHKELPSLFSSALPFVLSHRDLNVMNILANPKTGNITGIVDWAESRILPFGFALYGLKNLLGWMDSTGRHYYDHHRELEILFWKTFRGELTISPIFIAARKTGLFYHYGLVFDVQGAVQSVREEQPDGSLEYLNAFCTAGEWDPVL